VQRGSKRVDLYVVRHAVAHKRDGERWPDDAKRPLTPEGEERFRRAAGGILRYAPEVEAVLSSPFVRTWQTAEILEQAGWPAPVPCEELEPECPPHRVLDILARYEGSASVAIVGHRPGLHEVVSYLLTGDMIGEDCGARVQVKKGGVVRLSFDGPLESGAGSLEWLLTPKALRAAGRKRRPPVAGG
jgi:phosphohistidine phosphatase